MTRQAASSGESEKDPLEAYRRWLVEADHKASQSYDKTVLTLSGGALAVSFAFVKDIVPAPEPGTVWRLAVGWVALALSLLAILSSLFVSRLALRRAINQVDAKRIWIERPGTWLSWFTTFLNAAAGLAFLAGVGFLLWFALANLSQLEGSMRMSSEAKKAHKEEPAPKPTPKPVPTPKREGYEPPPPPPPPPPKKQ